MLHYAFARDALGLGCDAEILREYMKFVNIWRRLVGKARTSSLVYEEAVTMTSQLAFLTGGIYHFRDTKDRDLSEIAWSYFSRVFADDIPLELGALTQVFLDGWLAGDAAAS